MKMQREWEKHLIAEWKCRECKMQCAEEKKYNEPQPLFSTYI